ncbi:cAMP-binding protein [Paramagnetospirillum kuznetsovii]|uniref:cAMP-binding protein n=1 Tax=Paramagnetospirillum kuznetsovii TaxID=2053833 RepID=A0A364P1M6_9PROT|nr:cyclic nucleotide-binding domain-containing protein [Paramagnetospirillum kuznetsovii]RAU23221.1 cAMP-binding protein [Paramagnetospirillum kuznetsovii]
MSEQKSRAPERRSFAKASVIFREGEVGDKAYMLQQGTVRIFKTVGGKKVTIGHVRPFQVFGELSMMDDSPRMAGAIADEDVTCLVLEKEAIRAMMEQAPPGLNSLILSLLSSMRAMGKELADAKAILQEHGIEH